ncbi:MAG: radical SAM protein [Candidatus Omnitrophota bacterium]
MRELSFNDFYQRINSRDVAFPLSAHFELTYRCNLNCIHCYCKGSENEKKELALFEVKKIIRQLRQEGCIWLTLTGGEPLIRPDFLDIYSLARRKGFIITIFTNALAFNQKIINYLAKSPPFSIEITLNSLNPGIYSRITGVKNSLARVMDNIRELTKKKLAVIIKTNLLKQNINEIAGIKKWAEDNLARLSKNRYNFKCDPLIYPRLNANKTPCRHRLSPEEIFRVFQQDKDISRQYQEQLRKDRPVLLRENKYLYHCNSWMNKVFINPFGRLKFCVFSNDFSVDLKKKTFQEGFNAMAAKIPGQVFQTNSRCRDCPLRPICRWCPARAYLETGNREKPINYFCRLARADI